MPYQVAYEYHLGIAGRVDKARKIKATPPNCELQTVNDLLKNSVMVHSTDVLNLLEQKHSIAQAEVQKIVKEFEKEVAHQVETWKSQFDADWKNTRDVLADVFSDCTAEPPPMPIVSQRCDHAEHRYAQNIPPGYRDASKRQNEFGNKYGDALIWFELLDEAKQKQRNVIFVTFDLKSDWWDKTPEGSTARKELVNEMLVKSGAMFHLSTARRFAEWMQTTIGAKAAAAEVERLTEEQQSQTRMSPLTVFPTADGRVFTIYSKSTALAVLWSRFSVEQTVRILSNLASISSDPVNYYSISVDSDDSNDLTMTTVSFHRTDLKQNVFYIDRIFLTPG